MRAAGQPVSLITSKAVRPTLAKEALAIASRSAGVFSRLKATARLLSAMARCLVSRR